MAYALPQVQVFIEYRRLPVASVRPLQACVVGPCAQLIRYAEDDERVLGFLGAYNPLADQAYAYPNRATGAVIDADRVRLFADDAKILYFQDLLSADLTVAPVAGTTDRIAITGGGGFKANGVSFPRIASLGDRDVQPGDKAYVRAVVGGDEYELNTYVRAVEATKVAAVTGAATADANNGVTQASSSTVTKTSGEVTTNTLLAVIDDYDAWKDGVLDETYTLTVTKGSVGGDLSTAELRLTSASGLDDDLVVVSGDVDADFEVGHRGLKLRWESSGGVESVTSDSDLAAGEVWQVVVHDDYTAVGATSAGTYTGGVDTTYIVEVTRGGLFAAVSESDRPQITATTTTGVDVSGPTLVSATATAYPAGTYGVTISFDAGPAGLRKGDRFYIQTTAAKDGSFNILRLGHSIPAAALVATDMDLELSVVRDIEVPARREGFEPDTNFDAGAEDLTVHVGMFAYLEDFTDDGDLMPLEVTEAQLYVEYRAWYQELVGVLDGIATVDEIDAIPGPLHPDNPLKWGVFKALSNSNGATVWYSSVSDPDDSDAWADALTPLEGREEIYSVVPTSTDATVQDLVLAHCLAQSAPSAGQFRVCWLGLSVPAQKMIVSAATSTDGGAVLALLADDPGASGTQYTLLSVPAGNADFVGLGVRAGDIVRFLYSTSWGEESWVEFPVSAVLNEDTLRLAAGHTEAVTVARKMEIWRPLKKADLVGEIIEIKSRISSEFARWIWPDVVGSGEFDTPGYFLACALAGLRSGVAPHQGLTSVEVSGFDGFERVKQFSVPDLNRLAEAGIWIVEQLPTGVVATRHALTASTVDLKRQEESFQSNLHSVATQLRDVVRPYIGRTNVTENTKALLRNDLEAKLDDIRATSDLPLLGPQLRDGSTVTDVRESLASGDQFEVFIDLILPLPNNRTNLHLTV